MIIDPVAVLDIDGCLADFSLAFTQRFVAMGLIEKAVSASEQPTWYFRDSLPVTRADEDAVWAHIDASDKWWRGLPSLVTDGDMVALRELRKRVFFVYMTGRVSKGNGTYTQTKQWLQMNGLPDGALVMQGNKAKGVASLGGAVIGVIDDKPASLEALRDMGAPVVAMNRPYNAHVEVPRVDSLVEFAAYVVGRL